jgi:hypothetical protein
MPYDLGTIAAQINQYEEERAVTRPLWMPRDTVARQWLFVATTPDSRSLQILWPAMGAVITAEPLAPVHGWDLTVYLVCPLTTQPTAETRDLFHLVAAVALADEERIPELTGKVYDDSGYDRMFWRFTADGADLLYEAIHEYITGLRFTMPENEHSGNVI